MRASVVQQRQQQHFRQQLVVDEGSHLVSGGDKIRTVQRRVGSAFDGGIEFEKTVDLLRELLPNVFD